MAEYKYIRDTCQQDRPKGITFDVMVLYDWVARIPTIWFLIDGLMACTSCISIQPQCSSISRTLTSPLNGKLSLLSQSITLLLFSLKEV